LEKINFGRKHLKYISFRNASSNIKLGGLHINNVNNIEVRYKYLKNIKMTDLVEYDGKHEMLRDVILSVIVNNIPLSTRVEQGSGRRSYYTYLLMILNRRTEAQ